MAVLRLFLNLGLQKGPTFKRTHSPGTCALTVLLGNQQILTKHFISGFLKPAGLHDKGQIVLKGNMSDYVCVCDMWTYLMPVVKQPLKTKINCTMASCQ